MKINVNVNVDTENVKKKKKKSLKRSEAHDKESYWWRYESAELGDKIQI